MSLQTELLELSRRIKSKENTEKNNAIVLHAKAHMYNNQKMHDIALELLNKHNVEHVYFDDLDEKSK